MTPMKKASRADEERGQAEERDHEAQALPTGLRFAMTTTTPRASIMAEKKPEEEWWACGVFASGALQ
jgi:hypothetical protein